MTYINSLSITVWARHKIPRFKDGLPETRFARDDRQASRVCVKKLAYLKSCQLNCIFDQGFFNGPVDLLVPARSTSLSEHGCNQAVSPVLILSSFIRVCETFHLFARIIALWRHGLKVKKVRFPGANFG